MGEPEIVQGKDKGGDDPPADGGGRNAPSISGATRAGTTHRRPIPTPMLYRKGPGMGGSASSGMELMENRSGLIIDARLTRVSGRAERLAALEMIEPLADRPRAIHAGRRQGL